MPPQCNDSNSDMHPAPSQRLHFVDALTHISPCPLEWGFITGSICDLANAILLNNNWNLLSLQSPAQHLVPNKIILDNDIPLGIRRDLIVDIPVDPRRIVNLCIDNFCGLTMDIDDNAICLKRAPLCSSRSGKN